MKKLIIAAVLSVAVAAGTVASMDVPTMEKIKLGLEIAADKEKAKAACAALIEAE